MSNERQGRGTRGATLINENIAHSPAKLLTFDWLPCITIRPNRCSYLVDSTVQSRGSKVHSHHFRYCLTPSDSSLKTSIMLLTLYQRQKYLAFTIAELFLDCKPFLFISEKGSF